MGDKCEHDASTYDFDHREFAKHLERGADILSDAEFGWASKDGRSGPDHVFDSHHWQLGGDWIRHASVNILVPKPGVDPSKAVAAIFESPEKWSFDCSQFVQVLTFYAWLKLLGAKEFDRRVRHCGSKGIKIAPFEGSVFSRPQRRYVRKLRTDWMVDKLDSGPHLRLSVRELLDSAPVGSRVMFRNSHPDAAKTAFLNENTIKVGRRKYAAHPFGELTEDELVLWFYQNTPGKDNATLTEARRYVWVKEIDYFLDLATYTKAQRIRMIRNALKAAPRL